jgi:hypothetical protein
MANVKVCKENWNGVQHASFTWTNDDPQNDVIISQDGTNTWPFTTPTMPPYQLTVPKKSNGPGTLNCQLINATGTYTYNSDPCVTLGNPKTVIIT